MKKQEVRNLSLVTLALVLALSGCGANLGANPQGEQDAQDVQAEVSDAAEAVETDYSYHMGDTIVFTADGYNAGKHIVSGISGMEEWGTWTDGKESKLHFLLDSDAPSVRCDMVLRWTFNGPQNTTILVNGTEVFQGVIEKEPNISFTFDNPDNHDVEMTFLLPNAAAPKDFGVNEDTRILALGLISMQFAEDTGDAESAETAEDAENGADEEVSEPATEAE